VNHRKAAEAILGMAFSEVPAHDQDFPLWLPIVGAVHAILALAEQVEEAAVTLSEIETELSEIEVRLGGGS